MALAKHDSSFSLYMKKVLIECEAILINSISMGKKQAQIYLQMIFPQYGARKFEKVSLIETELFRWALKKYPWDYR